MNLRKYSKYLKEMKSAKPVDSLAVMIFFLGLAFIIYALNTFGPMTSLDKHKSLSLKDSKNILFLGIDEMLDFNFSSKKDLLWRGRSDTIIVANCNPKDERISILNIPRDTKIKVNKDRAEKINFINAIGGPKLTKSSLEKLLGIKIDHYIIVNLHGLANLIDAVGGIEIDVSQEMKYTDKTAMLYIDLKPGLQKLNGEEAIQFVRFRHDRLGDIGRIQRQQTFIKAVSKRLKDPRVIAKLPKLISKFNETVLTDMNAKDVIKLANFVRKVPSENQKIAMLPGTFSRRSTLSYWIPNRDGTFELVQDFFPKNSLGELLKKIDQQNEKEKKKEEEEKKEKKEKEMLEAQTLVEDVEEEKPVVENHSDVKNQDKVNNEILENSEELNSETEADITNEKIKISLIDGTTDGSEYVDRLKTKLIEYGYTVLNSEKYTLIVSKTIIYAKDTVPAAGNMVFNDLGNFGELIVSSFGSLEADVTILAGDDIKEFEQLKVE